MTEEIIIDCAFYKNGVCASPINKTCEYCKNIDVSKCYHKQLKRLEQENKNFEILAKSLYKRIEELEKENESLAFRERLNKADYEASEQENNSLQAQLNNITVQSNNAITSLEQENKELKEENKLLKDELYCKSEVEQCVQDLMEENTKLKKILVDIGFWDSEGNYKEDWQKVDVRELRGK